MSPIYKKWLLLLPWNHDKAQSCPSCGAATIEYRVIGDRKKNIGWALIWCNSCSVGIHISRMQLPKSVHIFSFEEVEAQPSLVQPSVAVTFINT